MQAVPPFLPRVLQDFTQQQLSLSPALWVNALDQRDSTSERRARAFADALKQRLHGWIVRRYVLSDVDGVTLDRRLRRRSVLQEVIGLYVVHRYDADTSYIGLINTQLICVAVRRTGAVRKIGRQLPNMMMMITLCPKSQSRQQP